MPRTNRRQFLATSGAALGLVGSAMGMQPAGAGVDTAETKSPPPGSASPARQPAVLYNTNLQTAVGMGDQPPGIVDKFGQLKARNVETTLALGDPLEPAQNLEWTQSLRGGYTPIVDTEVRSAKGSLRWSVFSSDEGDIYGDYLEIQEATAPYRLTLWFPFDCSIQVQDNFVFSGSQVLAVFDRPRRMEVSQARYNFRSRGWNAVTDKAPLPAGLDAAFGGRVNQYLNRTLEYCFPVAKPGKYQVFLGFPTYPILFIVPGQARMKLTVAGQAQVVDLGLGDPAQPLLQRFEVATEESVIRITAECDSSATNVARPVMLSGIWIFDHAVDADQVKSGKLNGQALFHVACGRDELRDRACRVELDYVPHAAAAGSKLIRLPYNACTCQIGAVTDVSLNAALAGTQKGWDSFLAEGAEFSTGVRRLDDLYKTSMINILLLRSRLEKAGNRGEDLYVLKPGATVYDAFWLRDGSYLSVALDVAGLAGDAERSLRLFWHQGLEGTPASMGQQASGAWQCPLTEWDGQGQALWALVRHWELTGDREWLRQVYPAIRKGAMWIKNATAKTQIRTEHGEKPIFFGLLPQGDGEAIGNGYIYYHNFWAVLGLREALAAARALGETADAQWIKDTSDEFCANLLKSVQLAYEGIGRREFIPGSTFDPRLDIWGGMAALYPARFLDPHDEMMTRTLDHMARHAKEDEYVFQDRDKIWTYITVDWALCYLLRDELPMFYRLFNGYVAHASPTNAWIEEIYPDTHAGTGDMPHGWAAGQYVHLLRNSLVFENEDALELCWGVQPEWLADGGKVSAKKAPTRFGRVDLTLQQDKTTLLLDYHLAATEKPGKVRLHIPPGLEGLTSVRINGQSRSLSSEERVVSLV